MFARSKWVVRRLLVVLTVLVLAVAIASTAVLAATRNTMYPNVVVAGIDLGGKTPEQARTVLEEFVNDFQTTSIQFTSSDAMRTSSLLQMGIDVDVDGTVEQAWNVGHREAWWTPSAHALRAMAGTTRVVPLLLTTNEEQYQEFLDELAEDFGVSMQEHRIDVVNHKLVPRAGRNGVMVDTDQLSEQLIQSLQVGQTDPILIPTRVEQPRLSMEQVRDVAETSEVTLYRELVLTSNDRTWTFTQDQIAEWLEFTIMERPTSQDSEVAHTLTASINTSEIQDALVAIGAELNVSPRAQLQRTAKERTEILDEGADGFAINVPELEQQVLSSLAQSNNEPRVIPMVLQVVKRPVIEQDNPDSPIATGKAIAVDLSSQTAYAYENGELLYFAKASTGRPPFYTKTGEWKVYYKTRSQTMSGPGYSLPNVQWTMFYDGGYSLHGTYWHNNFGTPMSHGCTNLTNTDAQWFWEWAPIGTPVVVYGETPRA